MTRNWVTIPNFVDPEAFCPGNRDEARVRLGIPQDALVVGCVAAVKRSHKRVDYLIRECSVFRVPCSAEGATYGTTPINHQPSTINHDSHPFLLIAGASTDESESLIGLAKELLPDRCRILLDYPHDGMPDLYRAMDVFVLPSLFEMMPIALIEAMASGISVIANQHPVMAWMVGTQGEVGGGGWRVEGESKGMVDGSWFMVNGKEQEAASQVKSPSILQGRSRLREEAPAGTAGQAINHQPSTINHFPSSGGLCIDMSLDGELAKALAAVTPEWLDRHGRQARERAVAMFSKRTVIRRYVEYYRGILQSV